MAEDRLVWSALLQGKHSGNTVTQICRADVLAQMSAETMKTHVEVLSDRVNCPVVEIPRRRFPGGVLQGDFLRIVVDAVQEIRELHTAGQTDDFVAVIDALQEQLAGYVASHGQAMREAGRELPYCSRPK